MQKGQNEHQLIHRVNAAKSNVEEADQLIRDYMPFIRTETGKFLKRPPVEGRDDELGIAMMAFYEAIGGYSKERRAFLSYAAMLIRSRLIDNVRKEQKHTYDVSMDAPLGDEDTTLADVLADSRNEQEERLMREATREEIAELVAQMKGFGVELSDVADNCPRQQRTLEACRKALQYARENPALLDELLRTGKLPISSLSAGSGAERKTLERHRKYMVALLLIYTNGFDILRGHLTQIMKGVTAK